MEIEDFIFDKRITFIGFVGYFLIFLFLITSNEFFIQFAGILALIISVVFFYLFITNILYKYSSIHFIFAKIGHHIVVKVENQNYECIKCLIVLSESKTFDLMDCEKK